MSHPFFGERWGSAAFEDSLEVPTPAGAECLMCHEKIVEGESGVMTPYSDAENASIRPVHIECWIRSVIGSPNHLKGLCSCNGGDADHLDDERSFREQAQESIAILRAGDAYWQKG